MCPSISIILAVYNGESYLLEQLDSIAAQSQSFDELLIRDDGSNDQTIKLIDDWIAAHPDLPVQRLTEPKENLGFTANFRTLLGKAKGDYILLCDQDDRWYPHKIEALANAAKNCPQAGLIVSSFNFMDQDGNPFTVVQRKGLSNQNLITFRLEHPGGMNRVGLDQILDHNIGQGCTMLVRQDVAKKYLAAKNLPLPHDWALAIIAALDDGLYYLDQPLMDYRIHQSNTTGLPQSKETSFFALLNARLHQYLKAYYRTAPYQDKLNALQALKQLNWSGWNQTYQERLAFFEDYLKTVNQKSWQQFRHLKKSPQKQVLSQKDWLLLRAYLLFGKP